MEPRQFGDLGLKRSPGVKVSRTLHGIWLFRKLSVPADADPKSVIQVHRNERLVLSEAVITFSGSHIDRLHDRNAKIGHQPGTPPARTASK
jgi:hypothetical protein